LTATSTVENRHEEWVTGVDEARLRVGGQREQRPVVLARDLSEASAGAACEIPAGLRARFVRAADELARGRLDAQSGAMTVDHPHVRAIAVEPNEFVGPVAKTCVIVTGHANVRF